MGVLGKHDKKPSWQEDSGWKNSLLWSRTHDYPGGPFLGLPTSPTARALGQLPHQHRMARSRSLWGGSLAKCSGISSPRSSALPAVYWQRENVSTRSSQDLDLEWRLVLTYVTLSSSISEEDWEGREEEEGQILTKMPCTSSHNLATELSFPSIVENHPTWEMRGYSHRHSWKAEDRLKSKYLSRWYKKYRDFTLSPWSQSKRGHHSFQEISHFIFVFLSIFCDTEKLSSLHPLYFWLGRNNYAWKFTAQLLSGP